MAELMSSRNFLIPQGRCAMVQLSTESANNMEKFLTEQGIRRTVTYSGAPLLGDFDFHITIFYTKTNLNLPTGLSQIDPFEVFPAEYKMLGENTPTLLVSGEKLINIRNTFKKLYDFEEEYPDYLPHISLSYDRDPVDLESLPIPTFPIIIDKLYMDVAD